ncbi:MAG: PQQ-dependent sugar dehydrogenase [Gemmatimonadetes bacterium]|nr:PQQ-dependent sugar dehydrogenase [Gemmatimonadota bacterium]
MRGRIPFVVRAIVIGTAAAACVAAGAPTSAQEPRPRWDGVPPIRLSEGELRLHTADEPDIVVRVLTTQLSHPWSLAFLPGGELLVTERAGRLRVIRDGVLDPTPIAGVPEVSQAGTFTGLLEVALHPRFVENRQLYLTYRTPGPDARVALARARFDGRALTDFRVLFQSEGDPFTTSSGSRLLFAPDGTLFMPVGGAPNAGDNGARAQDPTTHSGKILRLRDDGTAPADNPFVGERAYLPEIFSLGHRNPMGLALHPVTGELWAVEHGAQGGDEVNVVQAGRNYGWPLVSLGREYAGARISDRWWREGMEPPTIAWLPSIAPSGLMFYTGDRFPGWTGDLFVGAMMVGRVERTGHIERVVLNDRGEEIGREAILSELRQRIRDVRQGPDGLIYVLTDEDEGALLRIEPGR